jgi:esterase/lipase superfamily enzyme
MKREYFRWCSSRLGREMELLVFGHGGLPAIVFPTSQGRFYDFEDRGLVDAVKGKIETERLQLFCVDSVDAESWYSKSVGPRRRMARQKEYDCYIVEEVVPFARGMNTMAQMMTVGCSLGGFHAVNSALRHPEIFTGALSMSGAFDLKKLGFLHGHYDDEVYYNLPLDYLPNLQDARLLELMRRSKYVLATGVHDPCWDDNERLAAVMRAKGIPVRLEVWGEGAGHDWSWWQRMVRAYL